MDKPVIIFGAGGLGKAAQSIFIDNDVVVYCFLDDDASRHGQAINDVTVMGKTDDDGFLKYIGKKCEAFVAVDERDYHKGLVKMLKERRKTMPVNAIHAQANIAPSAFIGHGNFINGGVTIGADAKVPNHCVLHTNAVVDYLAQLGEFTQLGAGSIINAEAVLEEGVFVGSGAVVVSGVRVGKGARIGAGSVVVANVEEGQTVFGNPAKPITQ